METPEHYITMGKPGTKMKVNRRPSRAAIASRFDATRRVSFSTSECFDNVDILNKNYINL